MKRERKNGGKWMLGPKHFLDCLRLGNRMSWLGEGRLVGSRHVCTTMTTPRGDALMWFFLLTCNPGPPNCSPRCWFYIFIICIINLLCFFSEPPSRRSNPPACEGHLPIHPPRHPHVMCFFDVALPQNYQK